MKADGTRRRPRAPGGRALALKHVAQASGSHTQATAGRRNRAAASVPSRTEQLRRKASPGRPQAGHWSRGQGDLDPSVRPSVRSGWRTSARLTRDGTDARWTDEWTGVGDGRGTDSTKAIFSALSKS